ncbi:right-handed parallel beta-helix repeat-containing protein [Desulfonatronovibrio magnus]|uniref:right-handed parallel beta-helix repeat-containing protein n=1 Tax=Desulfonatronovibrio magnus TaxID=698827 RepID=UPI0006969081|nr:right-handed parallel beta-helix repeat-containing protein [Desulfonatronovibrio magnus]
MPSNKPFLSAVITFLFIFIAIPAYSGVLYVTEDGTGDGTSWANAFGDPQEAIELAAVDDRYSQVWVAAGTYLPTGHPNSTFRTREVHFSLRNGVTVYGGFIGNETKLEERDFEANETIFSGDIGVEGDDSDNTYHVFYHPEATEMNETAILDGAIVTNSSYSGFYNNKSNPNLINVIINMNKGGGIYNISSNPILTNVTISNNSNISRGGGMYNSNSNPTLKNVIITDNEASGMGGGIYNSDSNPTLINVIISNNSSNSEGGGIYNYSSDPTLTKVTIRENNALSGGGIYNLYSNHILTNVIVNGNEVSNNGGGIYNSSCNPTLINVTISNNKASISGGGIYNGPRPVWQASPSNPTMTNVTISNNHAEEGGGIFNTRNSNPILMNTTITNNSATYGGGMLNEDSNPVIKNSIFWGNSATGSGDEHINAGTSSPEVSWSIFAGGYPDGTNIITDDPLLQPLADNGGFTKTHAIPSDSPAYAIPESAGDGDWNDAPYIDQRGMLRATSGYRAIGSYEDADPDEEKQNAIAIFNAAESLYPDWFYPQGQSTQEYDGYEHRMFYRYYPEKDIFLLTYDAVVYYHYAGRYYQWGTVQEWLEWME